MSKELNFICQENVTRKYIIPFIDDSIPICFDWIVSEYGCGEGGNLKPFLDLGCQVSGIDISKDKVDFAERQYFDHPNRNNLRLLGGNSDFSLFKEDTPPVDLLLIKDTLEHIPDKDFLLDGIESLSAKTFISFAPWHS
ncbi:MAG: class I SAM-dependent methyltransferase, partial [Methanomicrobiales archaeon]|nr:class I SAM-dependent methyltransferase [Methanomicrobiales archaeon]